jgi:UDP-N-acetylmuramyl tripeptide synthase
MIAGLSARLRKLEAIAVHRQTRVIVINSGPGGKERAEREIAALEAAGCRDRIIRVCTGVRGKAPERRTSRQRQGSCLKAPRQKREKTPSRV